MAASFTEQVSTVFESRLLEKRLFELESIHSLASGKARMPFDDIARVSKSKCFNLKKRSLASLTTHVVV